MSATATQVRDLVFDIVTALGIMPARRIVPTFQWQPEDAPACGIYLKRERFVPDGDLEVGEIKFINTATIGISLIAKAKSPEELASISVAFGDLIEAALLTSIDLFEVIEGVAGIDRSVVYPGNASAYWAETRIELDVQFRSQWPPELVNELRHVLITTRQQGEPDDVPGLRTRIDLPGA